MLFISGARGFSFWTIIVQYDSKITAAYSYSWKEGKNPLKVLRIF